MPDGRPSPSATTPRAPPAERARVWLVEDSPLEAQRTLALLAGHYAATHFADAASMLEWLAEDGAAPDLLVLDWQLPGVSGLEALRFVREGHDEGALPVLMLTVRGAREDVREGLAAGANDYVAKPYDEAALLARVRTLVRVRRALGEARGAQALAERALREAEVARRERDLERERLRSLFEHAPALLATVRGPDHVFEMVNPLYRRTVGETRELLGRPAREAVPELVESGFIQLLDQVYRTGEPFVGREVPMRLDRTGTGVPEDAFFTFVYQPTRDTEGRVDGIAGFAFDVTEHVRARQQAEAAVAALSESADFERQLIGIVSHDLRNPLAAISMSAATLLRRPEFDDRQRPPVARILASAERATRMIRDLLDFTQARLGGGLTLQRVSVDLHALARQAADEVLLAHPGRTLQVQLEGEGRGTWDADRLQQLLGNLLANALAYSPPGSPVRLGVRDAGPAEGGGVVVEVHNEGEPIAPALLRRLFQPFERGEHQVNRAGRSIGLGLFIVQSIARAHGGSVEVQSTPEAGTCFRVQLSRGG